MKPDDRTETSPGGGERVDSLPWLDDGAAPSVALRQRLPAGIELLGARNADRRSSLHQAELGYVERAVPGRVAEFSTGRWLARCGLERLGASPRPVPAGSAGEPLWPPGIIGSLSHSQSWCLLAIGRAEQHVGIGVDLEISTVSATLADMILTPTEPPEYRDPQLLRVVFSAKEAVYKCIYPLYRRLLDFQDVEVSLELSRNSFSARLRPDSSQAPLIAQGVGVFETAEQGVVTVFTLPR